MDGAIEGALDEAIEIAMDGAIEGALDEAIEIAMDGAIEGALDEAIEGALDEAIEGATVGGVSTGESKDWLLEVGVGDVHVVCDDSELVA